VPNEQEVGRAPERFKTVVEKLSRHKSRAGCFGEEKIVDLCQESNADSLVAQPAVWLLYSLCYPDSESVNKTRL